MTNLINYWFQSNSGWQLNFVFTFWCCVLCLYWHFGWANTVLLILLVSFFNVKYIKRLALCFTPSYLFVVHNSLIQSRPPWCFLVLSETAGCFPDRWRERKGFQTLLQKLLQYFKAPQDGAETTLTDKIQYSGLFLQVSQKCVQYRFEVTVDDFLPVQHLQAPQEGVSESTDESQTEALEVVFFDELVQVHPEEKKETRHKICRGNLLKFPVDKAVHLVSFCVIWRRCYILKQHEQIRLLTAHFDFLHYRC